MKLGFPNHPRKDVIEEIRWIGDSGFDFVDLFLEEDKATPNKINVWELKEVVGSYSLDIIGHTAWYLPISSPSKRIRDSAVAEFERYLKVFHKLEVELVNIHANWQTGLFSVEEVISFQIESIRKIVKIAEEYGIDIMYEPIDTPFDTVENTEKILSAIPELYFHLDIGHASLYGRKPQDFIDRFHDRLRHVHLHDNNGLRDLHLPLGCGKIEWMEVLKHLLRYYNKTLTLEIFSPDREYVLVAKKKVERFLREHS